MKYVFLYRIEARASDRNWVINFKLSRNYDLPAITYPGGIEPGGTKFWYKNGKCHRGRDKPAVVYPGNTREYWINGKQIIK